MTEHRQSPPPTNGNHAREELAAAIATSPAFADFRREQQRARRQQRARIAREFARRRQPDDIRGTNCR